MILVEETLSPEEKVTRWHTGTRIVNIKLCTEQKLKNYFQIADRNNYNNICNVINQELRRRQLPELQRRYTDPGVCRLF